ncbi:hypothetical protein AB1Y20_018381 [Prymnesium parvum]|uniref:Uncharacterized protein n=1 Tax=Prymnesium parvum TaxID=97485 RepID=A0AB34JRU5_PRYPA
MSSEAARAWIAVCTMSAAAGVGYYWFQKEINSPEMQAVLEVHRKHRDGLEELKRRELEYADVVEEIQRRKLAERGTPR